MKKGSVTTVKAYLEGNILRQSVIGFTAMAVVSVAVTFFLARYKMATDLQKAAVSAAEAFRSRILEGDIKAVENQIHDVLGLRQGEFAFILNKDREHIYRSVNKTNAAMPGCDTVGFTCFDGYTGPGRIFLPIYFDEKRENIFGYLYLSKAVQIDWLFVGIVFSVFSLGYIAVLLGLGNLARASSKKLASEVEEWAQRLKNNPKSKSPLSAAPFSELAPLKAAIEGLTTQIENYETKAEEKAKMLVLRGIAHDLLSPVSQVQLYIATLELQMQFDPSIRDTMADVKASLKKVSMVASQVKALDDASNSSEISNLGEVAVVEIDTIQKSEAIAAKNIRLNISAVTKDIMVPLSNTEIARILQNLVENAADASKPGGQIDIQIDKDGPWAELSVADAGHGIPKHLQARVFDPDFTSKPSTGTGLGLFIVKHICEQKNGSVDLSSTPGQGTRVTVSVPTINENGGHHAI